MFKNEISIEDKELFEKYTKSYPYLASGLSFTSFFMWRDLNNFKYEIINDFLCISGVNHLNIDEDELFVLPPLAINSYDIDQLSSTIDMIIDRFKSLNQPFNMKLLPSPMIETFKKAKQSLQFTPDRDNFDYVYLREDLVSLKGRKYHSKKNHLNYFIRNTSYTYVPLTDISIEECMGLNSRLLRSKDSTPLESHLISLEEKAVYEALKNMATLNCRGSAILIDNKVEAFTLGAKLSDDTMVVHIEKANPRIRGLYQAINQQFCENECTDITYINREEDMGIENLRKAKLSYRPIQMVEKYDVSLKE